jgi:hypothetical protein
MFGASDQVRKGMHLIAVCDKEPFRVTAVRAHAAALYTTSRLPSYTPWQ